MTITILALSTLVAVQEPPSHVAMNGPISKIDYSHDGKLAAVGGMQGDIAIFDAATWEKRHAFKPGGSRVTDLAFSRDGMHIACSSQDKTIRITTVSGEPVHKFDSDGWGMTVSFSPDGKRLAGAFADGLVRVWDVASGKQLWASEPGAKRAQHLRFHPSADRIAFTDAAGSVTLIEGAGGKVIAANATHVGTPQFLSFSSDGAWLLVSHARGGNAPALALIATSDMTTHYNFESLMVDGYLTPDNAAIVGLGGDSELRVFDVGAKNRRFKGNPIAKFRFFQPSRMALSPDGKTALITGDLTTGFGFFVVPVESLK